ncbi:MAG: tRNA pseudouridine(38-40) synthase TruA [Clostridia bacterium]|nr:tRNA pseudouridine(38-40) synthase TruA [Clostridia bacterium]
MRNLLLKIEYDGTGFSGWARQPGQRTVQGELERVLSEICKADVLLNGTGRTDAGVHALGQRATFEGEFGIPTDRILRAANDMLAESRFKSGDVRITGIAEVPVGFHARFSAVGKTYVYLIRNSEDMPVFLRNYRYQVRQPLDVPAMTEAACYIQGTHDFACFQAAGGTPRETTVRTIHGISLDTFGDDIAIAVTGDGFLYNMVRIIAGTLADVGLGKLRPGDMKEILAYCDRTKAGHTAPPQGLTMADVYFNEAEMLEAAGHLSGGRDSGRVTELIGRLVNVR